MRFLALFVGLLILSTPGYAYIGPGVGAGALATAVGVLVAIVLAVLGVVYYPIKRMLKKRKGDEREENGR